METIRQKTFFRQWVLKEVAKEKQITETAIRYRISLTSIYRWRQRYDGTVESLYERSHRFHSHPSQHTLDELRLIKPVWSHNKGLGLVCLHIVQEDRHGYTRSVSSLGRAMKKLGIGRKRHRRSSVCFSDRLFSKSIGAPDGLYFIHFCDLYSVSIGNKCMVANTCIYKTILY